MEVILRGSHPQAIERVSVIPGVEKVNSSSDGPIQRLVVHVRPDSEVREEVREVLGAGNIEYLSMRDPTLEETYLSIIK
jgi:hypothetical protein